MTCPYSIIFRQYQKRLRKLPNGMFLGPTPPAWLKLRSTDTITKCDGKVMVFTHLSSGCCCHDGPEFEIEYKCEKCGNSIYIPRPLTVEDFIQQMIQKEIDGKP